MTKGYMTLEELNSQFAEEQKRERKGKKPGIRIGVVLFLLLVAIGCWGYFKARKTPDRKNEQVATQEDTEDLQFLPIILSGQDTTLSKEERGRWLENERDKGKVYIDVKSRVPLYGTRAYVDVVNPIYNAYPFSVRILSADGKDIYLGSSSLVEPGMTMKAVELTNVPKEKNSEAVIELIFYKDTQEELGRHKVNITFNKQSK